MLILALLLGAVAWSRWMATREQAIAACRRAGAERELQLLDETVCLSRVEVRIRGPRPALIRSYGFEYSATGEERNLGRVTLGHGGPPRVVFFETRSSVT